MILLIRGYFRGDLRRASTLVHSKSRENPTAVTRRARSSNVTRGHAGLAEQWTTVATFA